MWYLKGENVWLKMLFRWPSSALQARCWGHICWRAQDELLNVFWTTFEESHVRVCVYVCASLCPCHWVCIKIKIGNWKLIPTGLIVSCKENNGRHFTIPAQRLVVAALITIRLQHSKLRNPVGFKFRHRFGEFQNTNEILLSLWMSVILRLFDLNCPDLNLNEKKRKRNRLNRAGE